LGVIASDRVKHEESPYVAQGVVKLFFDDIVRLVSIRVSEASDEHGDVDKIFIFILDEQFEKHVRIIWQEIGIAYRQF
jgi:hypothetical protein